MVSIIKSEIKNRDCYIDGPYQVINYTLSNGSTLTVQPQENGIGINGLVDYNNISALIKILRQFDKDSP